MTLVEVLITIALIAVLSGALLLGTGFVKTGQRRAAATLIISGIRVGMTRSNTIGRPVRMVFDLENHRVMLEETNTSQMLRETADEDPSAGAEPADELEKSAREEAEGILDGPRKARPRFTPVKQFGSDGEDAGEGRALGQGIRFRQVQTEHDPEPRREGRAYLYIWPRGGTEEAAIQIQSGDDDEGLTIRVSALTGRARVERGRVDLPESRGEEGYSEREEE
jgi:general secretion pathway protein H